MSERASGWAAGLHRLEERCHPARLGYALSLWNLFSGWAIPGSAFRVLPVVLLVGFAAVLSCVIAADDVAISVCRASSESSLLRECSASLVVGDRWPYLFVWRYPLCSSSPRPLWQSRSISLHGVALGKTDGGHRRGCP